MMQAAFVAEANSAFHIKEVPIPVPTDNQVLVKIYASGVNPLDTKIRAGKAGHAKQPLPSILGIDLAGTIASVGSQVTAFKIGDEVYGMAAGIGGAPGSLAQYAAVDPDLLALKPKNLTFRQAAALPLIFITAYEGLVDRAQVHEGQHVLIHGGVGGVGHVAVQLARARGAVVYSTVSTKDIDLVQTYGATAIDRSTPVADYVSKYSPKGEGFDIVYDTVGGDVLNSSFVAARLYGGHVLSCLGWGTHSLAPLSFRAATYSGVFTLLPLLTGKGRKYHGRILNELTQLVEQGKLTVRLDERVFDLTTATAAHELVESGKMLGKVVVNVEHP